MRLPVPEGYVRVRHGAASAVVAAPCAAAIDNILRQGSLYLWASSHPDRREFSGRGAAYAVALPDCAVRVVVRRARHGGLLASIRGDVFLAPTRAPRELAMSIFLQRLGIETPTVVGYVTYRVGPLLRRADVLTAEVPNALDLRAFLAHTHDDAARQDGWDATARLLRRLTAAGVWHPDLNAKNVLLIPTPFGVTALVLDIDRVRLVVPGDPQCGAANVERLLRSLRKGQRDGDALEDELWRFAVAARAEPGESDHPAVEE